LTMGQFTGQLADEIRQLTAEMCEAGQTLLDKTIEAGGKLFMVKRTLKHGEWLPFVERCGISDQTARNWIRLYERRDRLKSQNVLNLTDAYAESLVDRSEHGERLIKLSSKLRDLTEKWKEECFAHQVLTVQIDTFRFTVTPEP